MTLYSVEKSIDGYVKRRRSEGWNDIDSFSIPFPLREWAAIQKALQRSEEIPEGHRSPLAVALESGSPSPVARGTNPEGDASGGAVPNDPTNWNVDNRSIQSFNCKTFEEAKEVAKRWNAYPGLVFALRNLIDADRNTKAEYEKVDWAVAVLKDLGEAP